MQLLTNPLASNSILGLNPLRKNKTIVNLQQANTAVWLIVVVPQITAEICQIFFFLIKKGKFMQHFGDSACMSHLNYCFFFIQNVAVLYTSVPLCGQQLALCGEQLHAWLSKTHLPPDRHRGEMNLR